MKKNNKKVTKKKSNTITKDNNEKKYIININVYNNINKLKKVEMYGKYGIKE